MPTPAPYHLLDHGTLAHSRLFQPKLLALLKLLNGSAAIRGLDDRQITCVAIVHPRTAQQPLPFVEAFHCQNGAAVPLESALTLIQRIQDLIQTPYLEWNGTLIQIKELALQKGRLKLQLETHVKPGIKDL
jgi:hypothetical protein